MEQITEMRLKMLKDACMNHSPAKPSSEKERMETAQTKADAYNKSRGNLLGYDCPDCLNRGYFARIEKIGEMIYECHAPCRCLEIRKANEIIEQSGLKRLLNEMTFDAYKTALPFQKPLKEACEAYAKALLDAEAKKPWLFIGGESGAGKTHLCTAVCAEAMKAGIAVRYMVWPEDMKPIRASIIDANEYAHLFNPFKNARLLYIDDLFKPARNKSTGEFEPPTPAEIQLAYELINHRLIHDLPTVISCEWYLSELVDIDAATGGRIKKQSEPYAFTISRDRNKNFRLTGGKPT